MGFPGNSDYEESTCIAGDLGSIPGLGRSPGGRHGNPLQCSCLENPYGQRSLAGYRPRGCKELDLTEQLNIASLVLAFTRLPEMPSFYEFNCHSNSDPRRQLLSFPAGIFSTNWILRQPLSLNIFPWKTLSSDTPLAMTFLVSPSPRTSQGAELIRKETQERLREAHSCVCSFLKKIKYRLSTGPPIPLLGLYPNQSWKPRHKWILVHKVHNSSIPSSQEVGAVQIPINRFRDRQSVVCTHNEILLGHKRRRHLTHATTWTLKALC